jgi:hypothetical protein
MADAQVSNAALPDGLDAFENQLAQELSQNESEVSEVNELAEGVDLAEQDVKDDEAEAEPREASAEESEDKEESEESEEVEAKEDGAEKGGRASKRIRDLVGKTKTLEEQLSRIRTESEQRLVAERSQYQQQWNQLQQYLQQQHAELQQLKQSREAEDEAKLSPLEQFKRAQLREAEALVEQRVAAKLQPLEQELQARREAEAKAKEKFEQQRRFQKYDAEAAAAIKTSLLAGADEKEATELSSPSKEMLLAWCAAFGETPEKGAKTFNQYIDRLVGIRQRAVAKKAGEAVAKSKKLPVGASAPRRASDATGAKAAESPVTNPGRDLLLANNFENLWAWKRAGSPSLRKK